MKVGYFKRSSITMWDKILNFENFENEGTDIQQGKLHVMLKILAISLLSRINDLSAYFGMRKESSHCFSFQ